MTIESRQLLLAYLGYYTLRRRDGSLAIDGMTGPALRSAEEDFRASHPKGELDNALRLAVANDDKKQNPPVPALSWPGKHFKRQEFACKCGRCGGFPVEPSFDLVRLLDKIREHFGRPVLITSGIRCIRHNANVGGVRNSKHLDGIAADIVVHGVMPSEVADYVETLMPNSGGIGRYNSFTHVDVRPNKSRWNG